ncbi:MAG: mannitol-1-phosphate 5-dehydrogenase [Armatimonadota bacterium]|nr:mannitol-1-phosphate 5-dehydrogenase [bacterium]MDW8321412.1 mannitol-1-phosphate 5-dehydrogenase [Armatimonadota bacterium]
MAERIAVQFGAGNIGRGFIAQLFHESGYEVVFVEAVPALVDEINRRRRYTIHIVGDGAQDVEITHIRAVHSERIEQVAQEVARAEVACTAVGVNVLKQVAPLLARGIALRSQNSSAPPLNILICENQLDADQILRNAVLEHLLPELHTYVDQHIGFVLCVVSRMVPQMTPEEKQADPLAIKVEAYKRLPVDAKAIKGSLPPIVGVEPVENFIGHVERKLFVHNAAHAILGYLGWLKGYTYVHEAMADEWIRSVLDECMREVSEAMVRKHAFTREEMHEHLADLYRRFENAALGDTIERVTRDPERKLRPNDRLVGAARLLLQNGLEPKGFCTPIAAALLYDNPADVSAVALQRRIEQEGVGTVLEELTGITADMPMHQCIMNAYLRMKDCAL